MAEQESNGSRQFSRRDVLRFGRRAAEYAAASYALTYVGAEALKALPLHSEIQFSPRQQVRILQEEMKDDGRQATLVLGGVTVRDPKIIVESLTPVFEKIDTGPVGSVVYAQNSTNPDSIAEQMEDLQRQHGIDTFSIYGHSIGPHVLGQVIKASEGRRPFKLKNVYGDCTPAQAGYGYMPGVEKFLAEHYPVENDPLLTMAITAQSYDGNPFYPRTALPPLFGEQVRIAGDESNLYVVADKLRADNGRFIFLRPEDPKADKVVNSERSQRRLEEIFGSTMQTQLVRGERQGHGNPTANIEGYTQALLLSHSAGI